MYINVLDGISISQQSKNSCMLVPATSVTLVRYSACEVAVRLGRDSWFVKSLGSDQMRYSDTDESLV